MMLNMKPDEISGCSHKKNNNNINIYTPTLISLIRILPEETDGLCLSRNVEVCRLGEVQSNSLYGGTLPRPR